MGFFSKIFSKKPSALSGRAVSHLGYSPPTKGAYGDVGILRTPDGLSLMEPMFELAPPNGLRKFRTMRINDPIVGGLILHIERIFADLEYVIEGPNEKFVKQVFDDMKLQRVLHECASACTYGFYLGEIIWANDGNRIIIKDIEPRHQPTITSMSEARNLVTQYAIGKFEFPYKKCLHFVPTQEGRDPYGLSLLRHLYKPYYFKLAVEAAEASSIDRDLSGLPVITAPEGFNFSAADPSSPDYDPAIADTLAWAINIVTAVRRDEQQGIVKPFGWTFDILRGEARKELPTSNTIMRFNSEIAAGLLMNFASLGGFASTNNANVDTQVGNFHAAMDSYASTLAMAVNDTVKKLCAYNSISAPTLRFKKLSIDRLDKLAAFVSSLVNAGAIRPTTAIEEELLRLAKLPTGGEILEVEDAQQDTPSDSGGTVDDSAGETPTDS